MSQSLLCTICTWKPLSTGASFVSGPFVHLNFTLSTASCSISHSPTISFSPIPTWHLWPSSPSLFFLFLLCFPQYFPIKATHRGLVSVFVFEFACNSAFDYRLAFMWLTVELCIMYDPVLDLHWIKGRLNIQVFRADGSRQRHGCTLVTV